MGKVDGKIFQAQGLNPGRLHCRQILYCLSPQGHPESAQREILKGLENTWGGGRMFIILFWLWFNGCVYMKHRRLFGKVPDAAKDWEQKEKKAWEGEMAEWHHQCNGHELGQILGDGEGQGGLACCSPWGCKEPDMTGRLSNNTNYMRKPPVVHFSVCRYCVSIVPQ